LSSDAIVGVSSLWHVVTGVSSLLHVVRLAITQFLFERGGRLETSRAVRHEELGIEDRTLEAYFPSGWLTLHRILPKREVAPDDVFLDVGSGKGRIVYLAARRYPFKQVIGVELSRELNAVARGNIERNRERLRCCNVELVTADARDYELPDHVTIIYFFNPFTGPVFSDLVDKIEASLDRRPRRLRVIYVNPVEAGRLTASGRARLLRERAAIRLYELR
jgi:SAM-dependent methyltransferase